MAQQLSRPGSLLAYNAVFERMLLRRLAARFSDLAPSLESAAAAMIDLLPLVRANLYHPAMRGSFALMVVAKAMGFDDEADTLSHWRAFESIDDLYEARALGSRGAVKAGELEAAIKADCISDARALQKVAALLVSA
jgi:predicted RecB family nuclease